MKISIFDSKGMEERIVYTEKRPWRLEEPVPNGSQGYCMAVFEQILSIIRYTYWRIWSFTALPTLEASISADFAKVITQPQALLRPHTWCAENFVGVHTSLLWSQEDPRLVRSDCSLVGWQWWGGLYLRNKVLKLGF